MDGWMDGWLVGWIAPTPCPSRIYCTRVCTTLPRRRSYEDSQITNPSLLIPTALTTGEQSTISSSAKRRARRKKVTDEKAAAAAVAASEAMAAKKEVAAIKAEVEVERRKLRQAGRVLTAEAKRIIDLTATERAAVDAVLASDGFSSAEELAGCSDAHGRAIVYVLKCDGGVVGVRTGVPIQHDGGSFLLMENFVLIKGYRGAGYASIFADLTVKHTWWRQGAALVAYTSVESNQRALRGLGFEQAKEDVALALAESADQSTGELGYAALASSTPCFVLGFNSDGSAPAVEVKTETELSEWWNQTGLGPTGTPMSKTTMSERGVTFEGLLARYRDDQGRFDRAFKKQVDAIYMHLYGSEYGRWEDPDAAFDAGDLHLSLLAGEEDADC